MHCANAKDAELLEVPGEPDDAGWVVVVDPERATPGLLEDPPPQAAATSATVASATARGLARRGEARFSVVPLSCRSMPLISMLLRLGD
jgi:hypothetical protein